ncbi:TetR/AcrR family transcriptional regulator [Hahella sp. KA22]|uniref:TetR/AcrR family transcriptional regulator n=1 Tax=Hahella sp. KA22 TaxID=1628392 RepID=UPI001F4D767A|nr:TetR/AcrR family transcriptional regulator [Hahella sp. KA22]
MSNLREAVAGVDAHQPYHHGNLRNELLDKALAQLKQVGPDKISLRALAREIGVSQTAPYRHFADKNALLAALAAQGYRELQRVTQEAADAHNDPSQQLCHSGNAYIQFARDNPEQYKLMFGPVIACPMDYPELAEAGSSAFQVILNIAAKGVSEGVFTDRDVSLIAHAAWSMVHGIASLWIDGMYKCTESSGEKSMILDSLKISLYGILKRDGD